MGSTFNVTLDDSSPMFSYLPYGEHLVVIFQDDPDVELAPSGLLGDGPVDEGWRAWYSQIGFNNDCGKESVGDSLHITSSAGASVQLTFSGTAVYLFGTANSSYEVSLDTRSMSFPPPLGNLLFSAVGLLPGTHYVNLTASPQTGQQLAFDRAIISDQTPQGSEGNPILLKYDNQNITQFTYSQGWSSKNDTQVPSRANPRPFHITSTSGSFVSMNFSGAVAVELDGSRNCGHGTYNVSTSGATIVAEQYRSNTSWLVGNAVKFYRGGLDTDTEYNLVLYDTAPDGQYLTFNYAVLYAPNITDASVSPEAHHDRNVGVIVGPVVAGVALVLVFLLLLFLRRRRSKPISMGPISPYHTFEQDAGTVSSGFTTTSPGAKAPNASLGTAAMENSSLDTPPGNPSEPTSLGIRPSDHRRSDFENLREKTAQAPVPTTPRPTKQQSRMLPRSDPRPPPPTEQAENDIADIRTLQLENPNVGAQPFQGNDTRPQTPPPSYVR